MINLSDVRCGGLQAVSTRIGVLKKNQSFLIVLLRVNVNLIAIEFIGWRTREDSNSRPLDS